MKYDRKVFQCLTLITQFGINILVPVFLCSFAGIYLDRKLGTSFLMVVLFFVGAMAGFRNIYVLARKVAGIQKKARTRAEQTPVQKTDKGSHDESYSEES